MNKIYRLAEGWYSFEDLPQGYIKIHALNCGSDKMAQRQARRILGDKKAQIDIINAVGQFAK